MVAVIRTVVGAAAASERPHIMRQSNGRDRAEPVTFKRPPRFRTIVAVIGGALFMSNSKGNPKGGIQRGREALPTPLNFPRPL
jgi:hypothetical protein